MSIVLDASVVAALVIPLPYSTQAVHKMTTWQTTKIDLFAPTLLEYEVITVLRKAIVTKIMDASEASDALENVLALGIRTVVPTKPLYDSALRWSELLNQKVAYDAQYLALAEQLGAQFWTADQRLTNGAQQAGATWVHWIGEKSDPQIS